MTIEFYNYKKLKNNVVKQLKINLDFIFHDNDIKKIMI